MRRNSVPEPLQLPFASDTINLASPRMGAAVIFATDEFFASKERLIEDTEPQFIPDKYDNHGKWMDGCESYTNQKNTVEPQRLQQRLAPHGGRVWCYASRCYLVCPPLDPPSSGLARLGA